MASLSTRNVVTLPASPNTLVPLQPLPVEPGNYSGIGWYGAPGNPLAGNFRCPVGYKVTKIYGKSGSLVDRLGFKCNDPNNTDIGSFGGWGGTDFSTVSPNGWTSISGRSGGSMDNFLGFGGWGGNAWGPANCPSGQYLVGVDGYSNGDVVKGVTLLCGTTIDPFCVDNLESNFCKLNKVNTDILNRACSKNFTQTCKDRRYELDKSIVEAYCQANPDDVFCSCYAPVPTGIPPEIAGLAQCWNQKCSSYGYQPNKGAACPPITICKQDYNTGGTANILTNNIMLQDCSTKNIPAPTPAPEPAPTPALAPTPVPLTPTDITDLSTAQQYLNQVNEQNKPNMMDTIKKYWIYILALILIIVVFGVFMDDDDDDTSSEQSESWFD